MTSAAPASATAWKESSAERRVRVTHKQKVEQLHQEVEQLSLELLAAKQCADDSRTRQPKPVGVWEAVARRQKQRRETAQQENAQLRRLSHAQARHLRGLRELLAKRLFRAGVDEQVRRFEGRMIPRVPTVVGELEATFRFLLGHMNREHARVDEVWNRSCMDRMAFASQRWLSSRESSVKFRQYAGTAKVIVPFAINAVQEACWYRLMHPPLMNPSAEYFTLVEQQGDTMQLILSTIDDEFKLREKLCTTSRQYVQRDRIIIATTGVSEPRDSVDMTSLGIKVHSTTLRVFREGEPLPSGERSTVVEVFWSARGFNMDAVTLCSENEFERYVDAGRTFTFKVMMLELELIEELLMAQRCSRSA